MSRTARSVTWLAKRTTRPAARRNSKGRCGALSVRRARVTPGGRQEGAREMERNAGWIRRGQGESAALSEAQATAGLNQLRDQLHQVEQALGKGNQAGPGQSDKGVAQALDQVEQLRRQMEQLQSQLANRGQQQSGSQSSGRQGTQGQPGQQSTR